MRPSQAQARSSVRPCQMTLFCRYFPDPHDPRPFWTYERETQAKNIVIYHPCDFVAVLTWGCASVRVGASASVHLLSTQINYSVGVRVSARTRSHTLSDIHDAFNVCRHTHVCVCVHSNQHVIDPPYSQTHTHTCDYVCNDC